MKSSTIINCVDAVTKKWTKQRKAEQRRASACVNRRYALCATPRTTLIDAAEEVMEFAYNKASSNGKYPALARQIYYAARPRMLEIADDVEKLSSNYFTQTLLPGYMKNHPEARGWNVAYDARGHFLEPHTKNNVALGTLEVRAYLAEIRNHVVGNVEKFEFKNNDFPTCRPKHRFSAIMFIEKEGFLPLFQAVKLAERHDVAIMSTKGMSVIAARQMVDTLCRQGAGIPLLVLRDFDKSGFSIVATLARSTERYRFQNRIKVVDLGLRLADVKKWRLQKEEVSYRSNPWPNLRKNGATEEEIKFLCRGRSWPGWNGHRVELNAFTSEQLVKWIESKLQQHGVKKLVPSGNTLKAAYRRAWEIEYVNSRLAKIADAAAKHAKKIQVPKSLDRLIRKRLKEDPTLPWAKIVAGAAVEKCKKHDDGETD